MSQTDFVVQRNAPVTRDEYDALRITVGWNSLGAKTQQVLTQAYAHFSIRDEHRLFAYAHAISDGLTDALLVDVMVHPDMQGRGLGRKLVRYAIKALHADGIAFVQMVFDPSLEPFYRACGLHIASAGIADKLDPKWQG